MMLIDNENCLIGFGLHGVLKSTTPTQSVYVKRIEHKFQTFDLT